MVIIFYILFIVAAFSVLLLLLFQNQSLRHSIRNLTNDIDKEKEMDSQKQSFVATITHDLKTPTNAQINMLNMMLDGNFGKLNPEQREMLSLTQSSCKYMSELIGIIMDIYSYDYGAVKLNYENFDIIDLIEFQCKSLKSLSNKHNKKIIFTHTDKKFLIFADKLQIKRVILNLLSNAITYAYDDSSILVNTNCKDGCFEFSVENISLPIPENELNTIFDRYKKTKFSYFNKSGSGLGLYLSKQIIELHGGKIYAKSFNDGKCLFGFTIPYSINYNISENLPAKI